MAQFRTPKTRRGRRCPPASFGELGISFSSRDPQEWGSDPWDNAGNTKRPGFGTVVKSVPVAGPVVVGRRVSNTVKARQGVFELHAQGIGVRRISPFLWGRP